MARKLFKSKDRMTPRCGEPASDPARPGLSREIVKLLISGPAGSSDLALQTLLLRDRPGGGKLRR